MYQVKNIDWNNWKDYKYMVIRDCRGEKAPDDGYWFWGVYNNVTVAFREASELSNGVLVETADVEPINY